MPTILEVVCRTTGMGFAAVARVTEDRWVACGVRDGIAFGLQPGGELKVETTICHEIRQNRDAVIIDHVSEDDRYCGHPTPAMYGFQSYISMPIILPDGSFFGTLCAIDPRPIKLNTPETIGMFKMFAELIAFHLDANKRVLSSEATLLDERRSSELREQFIAVLGHDLRNPLTAIGAGAELLSLTGNLDEKAARIVGRIEKSVDRMSEMIDNVLDFARGRLGGGLMLNRRADTQLEPVLTQIIAELRASSPESEIDTVLTLPQPVNCDGGRIGQLLSNLLGNALMHGAAEWPVRVRAATSSDAFELSVANSGNPISPETLGQLFHPFSRGAGQANQEGLGLGLYIAHEIARAHGGTLNVASSTIETCFIFRMPRS